MSMQSTVKHNTKYQPYFSPIRLCLRGSYLFVGKEPDQITPVFPEGAAGPRGPHERVAT